MQDAAPQVGSEIPPQFQQPIILNPGLQESKKDKVRSKTGSILGTFGILLAGWFFGNLILLAIFSVGVAVAAGSTGLVKVPIVSERFFGKAVSNSLEVDQNALENAQEKLNTIASLSPGQTLKSVALDEEEINALLSEQIATKNGFPIANPTVELSENQFIFSGKMLSTNAPVKIVGKIEVSNLVANVEIVQARFGKIEIPTFIASNLLESYLSEIGLTLSSSQLPAKSIRIGKGEVSLIEVSNPEGD